MKFAITVLLAGTIALGACNESVGGPGASTYYDCGGGTRLKVDYVDAGSVMVQMNDNAPVTIPAERAASGAKYMSATHQFWSNGNEAMWTVGRMAPMTCTKVALPRGM
ncbi:MliC family protein [Erythrobacter sp.]|uniref:MliC family protein n=1 Tax=Erythrobacter sp. TaxID=1042 RepID=UPI0025EF58C5|nr:MliC family protein [Erythrobacter sp.]